MPFLYISKISIMDIESSVKIDGNLSATTITSKPKSTTILNGATSLPIVIVDWSLSNTFVLDFTPINLTAGSIYTTVKMYNASVENFKQKLIVKQPTAFGQNIVNVSLAAWSDSTETTQQTIEDVDAIENIINAAAKTSVIEFDLLGQTYLSISNSYIENNDYSSTHIISDNDSYTTSLSKLDDIVNKLKPQDAQLLSDVNDIVFDATTPKKLGWKHLSDGTAVNNLVFADPIIYVNEFRAAETNTTNILVDSVNKGAFNNTAFSTALPQTLQNLASYLTKTVFNPFSSKFDLKISLQGANQIAASGAIRDLTVNSNFITKMFEFVKAIQPSQTVAPSASLISCNLIPPSKYVCGIPVLRTGDQILANIQFNNISYVDSNSLGVYGSTVGKITGQCISALTVQSSTNIEMLSTAPNAVCNNISLAVLANMYQDNATINAANFVQEIGTVGQSAALSRTANQLIVDSITNTALFGIDHTQPLTAAININKLLVLGGIVQYPKLDYSNVWTGQSAISGRNYSVINNDRYVEAQINLVQCSRLKIDFANQTGFTNAAIEQGAGYQLSLYRSDLAGTWNGNLAYDGVGIVQPGDGSLDVAASSMSSKVVTFGQVVTATITVRITLSSNSNHKFSQTIVLTPML